MKIESERFGTLDLDENEIIRFPQGVIGFPKETQFILIRHGESPIVAWLQSATNAALAFPVVSVHGLTADYPDVPIEPLAAAADLGDTMEDLAVMAVLCAVTGQPATVNLLAPVVVNVATRRGSQLILDGSRFSTRELFMLPSGGDGARQAQAPRESAGEVAAE